MVELVAHQTAQVDPGIADHLRQKAHVMLAAHGGVELFRQRRDHGGDDGAHLRYRAGGFHRVKHGDAAPVDAVHAVFEDRFEQHLAGAEMVMQRGHVLLAGGAVDFAQRDVIDAFFGEQTLGGEDKVFAGIGRVHEATVLNHLN